MVKISEDIVVRLAEQSAIALSSDEIAQFKDDLEEFEDSLQQMMAVDTHDVSPTYQVTGNQNVWRDDTVDQHLVAPEVLVALAEDSQNDQIKVPKVL